MYSKLNNSRLSFFQFIMLARAFLVATALYIIQVVLYAAPSITSQEVVEVNKMGSINFAEEKFDYNFYLNTSAIAENITKINIITDEILKICNKTYFDECHTYELNKDKNAKLMKSKIEYINAFNKLRSNRTKRCLAPNFLCWHPKDIGTMNDAYKAISSIKKELTPIAVKNYFKHDKKIALHLLEKYSDTTGNRVKKVLENTYKFYNMTTLRATVLAVVHENIRKLEAISGKKPIGEIWSAKDLKDFSTKISNLGLSNALSLPSTNLNDTINLSEVRTTINQTHVRIVVKVPIIRKAKYTLHRYIPLPFRQRGATYVINATSGYFIRDQNGETFTLPQDVFNKCATYNDMTICDILVGEHIHKTDECLDALFSGHFSSKCRKLKIDSKNYLVKLSSKSVFCYVVEPIGFEMSCNEKKRLFNVTNSMKVNVSKPCILRKLTFSQTPNNTSNDFISNLIPESESIIINTSGTTIPREEQTSLRNSAFLSVLLTFVQGKKIVNDVSSKVESGAKTLSDEGSKILNEVSDTIVSTSVSMEKSVSEFWQPAYDSMKYGITSAWVSTRDWCTENIPYAYDVSINWVVRAAEYIYEKTVDVLLKIMYVFILFVLAIAAIRYSFGWLKKRIFKK